MSFFGRLQTRLPSCAVAILDLQSIQDGHQLDVPINRFASLWLHTPEKLQALFSRGCTHLCSCSVAMMDTRRYQDGSVFRLRVWVRV